MKNSNNREIDKWLSHTVPAWCEMDFNTFGDTVSWFAYDPLIANNWLKRILKIIDRCEEEKMNMKEITSFLTTPSEVRATLGMELWAANFTSLIKYEKMKIFNFFNLAIKEIAIKDIYAKEKNIIHSEKEIEKRTKKLKRANQNIAKKMGRLVNACYHLGHALYSDMHPSILYENYGPYKAPKRFGKNNIVAIKEFINLNSKGLFKSIEKIPCDEIKMVCVYKNVKMTVDAISHAVFQGDLIKNLKYYSVKADDKEITARKMDELSEKIEKLAIKVFQRFQKLNFEERKRKYYFQKAYNYKFLCERLGIDWRPSKKILNEAKGKKLFEINWPSTKKDRKKLVRKLIDPRIKVTI